MIKNEIWVYAEHHRDLVSPVTYELISKAKEISNNKRVVVLLFEGENDNLEKSIKEYGPDEIIAVKDNKCKDARDSLIADLIKQLCDRKMPNSILFGATVIGRSISARLQAKLNTGLTSDCLNLSFEEDLLVQTKPSYGDNIMCEIVCPNNYPQMATVRPGIFKANKNNNKDFSLRTIKDLIFKEDSRIKVYSETPLLSKGDSIKNANRVIAIGRGASDKKTLANVLKLSTKLGAKIGVTRPLTDLEGFSMEDQIGQSGNTISPKLLITLGVSGAVQFTSGILNSEILVAVNNNKNAPIFDYADYSFVGDANLFIEELLKIIK